MLATGSRFLARKIPTRNDLQVREFSWPIAREASARETREGQTGFNASDSLKAAPR